MHLLGWFLLQKQPGMERPVRKKRPYVAHNLLKGASLEPLAKLVVAANLFFASNFLVAV